VSQRSLIDVNELVRDVLRQNAQIEERRTHAEQECLQALVQAERNRIEVAARAERERQQLEERRIQAEQDRLQALAQAERDRIEVTIRAERDRQQAEREAEGERLQAVVDAE